MLRLEQEKRNVERCSTKLDYVLHLVIIKRKKKEMMRAYYGSTVYIEKGDRKT